MRKIFALLIVGVFLMSAMAVAEQGSGNNDSSGTGDNSIGNSSDDSIHADDSLMNGTLSREREIRSRLDRPLLPENRFAPCVKFLRDKTNISDPANFCARMTARQLDCAQFMKEQGIADADKACAGLMMQAGKPDKHEISGDVRDQPIMRFPKGIASWRTNRTEKMLEGRTEDQIQRIANLTDEQFQIFLYLSRAEQKRLIERIQNANLSSFELKKVKMTDIYRKREISQDDIKFWQKEFADAKERFRNATNREQDIKNKWLLKKDQWKLKCASVNSTECQELEAQAIENAKEFLNTSITKAIEHLNQIKSKVASSDSLTQEQVNEMNTYIDLRIDELEKIQDDVDKADTREEVKSAAQDLGRSWMKVRWQAVAFIAHITNTRVDVIIHKSEKLEDRLDCALQQMKDAGNDTAAIDSKIDAFSEKVADARDDWKKAKDLYAEIRALAKNNTNGTNNDAVKAKAEEMKTMVQSAHDKLQEAHTLLTEIYREIRASGVDVGSCKDPDLASDEEYVVEENTDN
jgi:hypothetical protein